MAMLLLLLLVMVMMVMMVVMTARITLYFFPTQPIFPPDVCLAYSAASFRALPKCYLPREALPEYTVSLCSITYLVVPYNTWYFLTLMYLFITCLPWGMSGLLRKSWSPYTVSVRGVKKSPEHMVGMWGLFVRQRTQAPCDLLTLLSYSHRG